MEAQILNQLNALDSALSTLTRSISTLTPSTTSTNTLISEAHSLRQTLSSLATHQSNVQRIAALQSEATSLDIQLQTQLSALAELRGSIKSAALSRPPPNSRAVSSSAITTFARHFARAGPPKGWKPPSVLQAEAEQQQQGQQGQQGQEQQGANGPQTTPSGSATPALPILGARTSVTSPEALSPAGGADTVMADAGGDTDAQEQPTNPGIQGLSEGDKAFIDSNVSYMPWVDQETMQRSALRQYQGEAGQALAQWRHELEAAKGIVGERAKLEREARERREMARQAAMIRDEEPVRNILDD